MFSNYGTGLDALVNSIALDGDDNLYVTGQITANGGVANSANLVAKFSSVGVFNQAFSDNLDVTPGVKLASSGLNHPTVSIRNGNDLMVWDNSLYVVGYFQNFKGITNNARGIAKFTLNGIFDQSFSNNLDINYGVKSNNSGSSHSVNALTTDGEWLYIGGGFNRWQSETTTYANNGLVKLSFAGVNGELIMGGTFTEFKNLKYEKALILNRDGTLPTQ